MHRITKSENYIFFSIVAIILLIPAVFYDTTLAMAQVWIVNETFTHGFLILPISLWLLWQKRTALSKFNPIPEPRLLVLLILILIAWFISQVVDVQVVSQLSLISIIPVLIWLLFGRKILLLLLFPILYLFFSVPLGQSLIPPLMEFTADFTVFMIKLVGIPVYRDGLHFTLPSGNWSVVEECSGVRYLIASVALGTIYAYTNYNANKKRLVFIIASILVPIIANGLRAFGIVITGHLSGMKLATGVDHLVYGWVFFGIIIFIMFYIGSYWWDPVDTATAKLLTEKPETKTNPLNSKTFLLLAVTSIIFIISIKLYAYQVLYNKPEIPENFELTLPDHFEGWQFSQNHSLNWKPEFSAPDATINKAYLYGNDFVQIDIGYYLYQRPGAETVTSVNRLTNPYGGEWKLTFSTDIKDHNFFVKEVEIRKSDYKLLIWQWYRMGTYQSPSPYVAKVFEAYNKIINKRTDGAYISISTILSEDKELARSRLREFLITSFNEINLHLDSLRK